MWNCWKARTELRSCVKIKMAILGVYMSAEEAGAGERGRECESEVYIHIFLLRFILFYCYFKCTFLSLEPMCQRIYFFIFMLCIYMNNISLT